MTEGELWAAAELHALRVGRWRPRAWARFVRSSFARASQTRAERPELAWQAWSWSAIGLAAGLAVCGSRKMGAPRPYRFALWWLATAAMLNWHLGMLEGPGGEAHDRLTAADALTLARIWSVPLLMAQCENPRLFAAFVAAAGATDALDGALARRVGPTRLGRDLDTVADAITSAAAVRTARRAGWLPARVAGVAAVRTAAPMTVVAASYLSTGQRPELDPLSGSRRLAPILVAGLAVSPFCRRLGAALTAAASIGALGVATRAIPTCRDQSRAARANNAHDYLGFSDQAAGGT
jgi:CDP-diacylglycerol--glycerol-3-phosphate 3-phosphatidyltransferase